MLWGTGIGQLFFSIRKQHTVNKGTRVQGNGSEYSRGVVFSYSFSIYCAAYHGIWCSGCVKSVPNQTVFSVHRHSGRGHIPYIIIVFEPTKTGVKNYISSKNFSLSNFYCHVCQLSKTRMGHLL